MPKCVSDKTKAQLKFGLEACKGQRSSPRAFAAVPSEMKNGFNMRQDFWAVVISADKWPVPNNCHFVEGWFF